LAERRKGDSGLLAAGKMSTGENSLTPFFPDEEGKRPGVKKRRVNWGRSSNLE